ncbi:hypothetical protein IFO70_14385 [Phormidium tenue FACHB-886]|nr:hypothetical protein [Phormidium tenue FACHB-886]
MCEEPRIAKEAHNARLVISGSPSACVSKIGEYSPQIVLLLKQPISESRSAVVRLLIETGYGYPNF